MAAVQAHAVSAQKLVWEARQQIGRTTAYDPAYSNIGYPMGMCPYTKACVPMSSSVRCGGRKSICSN